MAQVPVGTTFTVTVPGFVPVCRGVVADGEDVVTLVHGRPVRVLFSRPLVAVSGGPPGLLDGHRGSACPVRLASFEFQLLREAGTPADAVSEVLIRNFPVEDQLTFFWGTDPRPQPVVVDPDRGVRITIPAARR